MSETFKLLPSILRSLVVARTRLIGPIIDSGLCYEISVYGGGPYHLLYSLGQKTMTCIGICVLVFFYNVMDRLPTNFI